jgi:GT2 family glycosyltransferase
MKTAIVILNWNGVQHLRRYLPSVVAHSEGADVVVADNGSTDDSLAVLAEEFPSVRRVVLGRNYGFAEGYNRALAELEGYECFVLLNSDVEVGDGWLAPLVAVLDAESDVAVVAPKILSHTEPERFEYAGAAGGYIDLLGYPFCRGRILNECETDGGQYDDRRDVFWVGGAAFCVRTEAYRAMGGLCGEFFAHQEEIDLCWRLQLAGWRIVVEPKSRVWHLGGGTLQANSPQKIFLNHRNNLAMLFRCASPLQRALVAVVRPIADVAAALSYAIGGNTAGAKAVVRAWKEFMKWHGRLSRERRQIRSEVKGESQHIYKGSIVLRFALGRRQFGQMM